MPPQENQDSQTESQKETRIARWSRSWTDTIILLVISVVFSSLSQALGAVVLGSIGMGLEYLVVGALLSLIPTLFAALILWAVTSIAKVKKASFRVSILIVSIGEMVRTIILVLTGGIISNVGILIGALVEIVVLFIIGLVLLKKIYGIKWSSSFWVILISVAIIYFVEAVISFFAAALFLGYGLQSL